MAAVGAVHELYALHTIVQVSINWSISGYVHMYGHAQVLANWKVLKRAVRICILGSKAVQTALFYKEVFAKVLFSLPSFRSGIELFCKRS